MKKNVKKNFEGKRKIIKSLKNDKPDHDKDFSQYYRKPPSPLEKIQIEKMSYNDIENAFKRDKNTLDVELTKRQREVARISVIVERRTDAMRKQYTAEFLSEVEDMYKHIKEVHDLKQKELDDVNFMCDFVDKLRKKYSNRKIGIYNIMVFHRFIFPKYEGRQPLQVKEIEWPRVSDWENNK